MKIFRIILATSVITGFIWLKWWVVFTFGIFQLSEDGPSESATGFSLVLFENQQQITTYPLKVIEIGWSGIQTAWPFVFFGLLLGVMFGYPLGELARRKFAIDQMSKEALRESRVLTLDTFIRERRDESMISNTNILYNESQQLKEEVARMRKKMFVMSMSAKEQTKSEEKLRRKMDSVNKELVKAKAKIRRLAGKERPPGEKVD